MYDLGTSILKIKVQNLASSSSIDPFLLSSSLVQLSTRSRTTTLDSVQSDLQNLSSGSVEISFHLHRYAQCGLGEFPPPAMTYCSFSKVIGPHSATEVSNYENHRVDHSGYSSLMYQRQTLAYPTIQLEYSIA